MESLWCLFFACFRAASKTKKASFRSTQGCQGGDLLVAASLFPGLAGGASGAWIDGSVERALWGCFGLKGGKMGDVLKAAGDLIS